MRTVDRKPDSLVYRKILLLLILAPVVMAHGLKQIPYRIDCTRTIGGNTSRYLFEDPGRIGARVTRVFHSADIPGPQWTPILVHEGSPTAGTANGPAWIYEVSYRNPETEQVSRYQLRLLRPEEGESATTVMAFYSYDVDGNLRQGRDFRCRPYVARGW